jgi:hypothetical protein
LEPSETKAINETVTAELKGCGGGARDTLFEADA